MDHVLLLFLSALLAVEADQSRGPDAHDLRREPGDVIMVDGRPDRVAPPKVHGPYVAPCPNWKYSRLRPGQRLAPAFLHSRYTISAPAQLGLSAAGKGHRWIRYGNDAVLVGSRSSRVIQIVHHRFR